MSKKRRTPHHTWKGRPKVGYLTMDEAAARASTMTEEQGKALGPYQCDECDLWHVGHAWKKPHPMGPFSIELIMELGERAYGCLAEENGARDADRLKTLRKRGLAAKRRAWYYIDGQPPLSGDNGHRKANKISVARVPAFMRPDRKEDDGGQDDAVSA